jgi:hypothetical protein
MRARALSAQSGAVARTVPHSQQFHRRIDAGDALRDGLDAFLVIPSQLIHVLHTLICVCRLLVQFFCRHTHALVMCVFFPHVFPLIISPVWNSLIFISHVILFLVNFCVAMNIYVCMICLRALCACLFALVSCLHNIYAS